MNRLALSVLALLVSGSAFAQPIQPIPFRTIPPQTTVSFAEQYNAAVLIQVGAASVSCAPRVIAAMGSGVRCAVTSVSKRDTLSALESGWPLAALHVFNAQDARARWGVGIAADATFLAWQLNTDALFGECRDQGMFLGRVTPICYKKAP